MENTNEIKWRKGYNWDLKSQMLHVSAVHPFLLKALRRDELGFTVERSIFKTKRVQSRWGELEST